MRPEGSAVGRSGSKRSLLIAAGIAAVLLFLAFRGVDWGDLLARLLQADPGLVLLAIVGYSGSFFLRGVRWSVLLRAEQAVSPITVFWATAVGYLGNNFLPARAGELLRSAMLGRTTRLGTGFVLATALTERILDAIWLVLVSLAILSTLEGLPDWLTATTRGMAVVGGVGLAGLLLASRLERLIGAAVARLPVGASTRDRLASMVGRFLLGLRAFQHVGRAVRFFALTVVLWMLDGVAALLVGRALGVPLSFLEVLLLLAALGLASAAPSTPGYVGIYQFVAVTLLAPFGYSQAQALAYVLLLQAVIYVVTLIWGLPAFWRLSLGRSVDPDQVEPHLGVEPNDRTDSAIGRNVRGVRPAAER